MRKTPQFYFYPYVMTFLSTLFEHARLKLHSETADRQLIDKILKDKCIFIIKRNSFREDSRAIVKLDQD